MTRRDILKRILIASFIPLSYFAFNSVFASEPILPDQLFSEFTKQDFSKQILCRTPSSTVIPRATRQAFGNVVVYNTVRPIQQRTLERWSHSWDVLIRMIGWWWIDQIPPITKVIMVSEEEMRQSCEQALLGGFFRYPDEIWLLDYDETDSDFIHEALHKILTWIYISNYPAFPYNPAVPNTIFPYSPLIVAAAEMITNRLNAERGANSNPLLDQARFNRLWDFAKQIMQTAGFVGLERVPPPEIIENGASPIQIIRFIYESMQRYNGTGEIYLSIIMFSAILDFYNFHRDHTGIFERAVCNAKQILDQEMGFIRIDTHSCGFGI